MTDHLNNILKDLKVLVTSNEYKFSMDDVDYIQKVINSLLNFHDIKEIDFDVLKELSNKIYDLNLNNSFSTLTDHISNELYAFEFLLQENLKRNEE